MMNYSIVIQAGGQSTRMGQDKGLLQFGKYKMVEYILHQVSGMGEKNFIVSNRPEEYKEFGLPVYTDIYHNIGPLGGFHTIFSFLEMEYALVLACDMPFINRDLINYLLSLASDYDIIVPRLNHNKFVKPFRAVYSKRCMPAVEKAIEQNHRRVISFFDDVRVRYLEKDEIHIYDPDERSFFNVNTPEDLQKAIQMAGLG
ncbi:MAG: molybdenum cofactor guanylyltransferase [Anaerolineales bacterium]